MFDLSCLIIGLGSVGIRHAQSFAEKKYSVYYIDPKINNKDFIKIYHVNEFPGNVIILATTSKERMFYIKMIEMYKKNCSVILEKPLFNNYILYTEFTKLNLFNNYYINLVLEPLIKKILKRNNSLFPNKITIHGNSWGLACNIMHDISILGAFKKEFKNFVFLKKKNLKIIKSKRSGFLEIIGTINFNIDDTNFIISCGIGKKNKIIDINFDDYLYKYNYFENCVVRSSNQKKKTWKVKIPKISSSSCYFYEKRLIPIANKYTNISMQIYSELSRALNLNGNFPFT
jgi:hypothetical protein